MTKDSLHLTSHFFVTLFELLISRTTVPILYIPFPKFVQHLLWVWTLPGSIREKNGFVTKNIIGFAYFANSSTGIINLRKECSKAASFQCIAIKLVLVCTIVTVLYMWL